jgi:hypothetical protein
MRKLLQSPSLRKLFEKTDEEFAQGVREGGCIYCQEGALHRSDYERKPRGPGGKNGTVSRTSFCCSKEGCRKRHTPVSMLFLGRRVYDSVVVVLLSAMSHGVNARRAEVLREQLGIDRATLQRWRAWWLKDFVQSAFWRGAKSLFAKPVMEDCLPRSLVDVFKAKSREGLLKLLLFLRPICGGVWGMTGGEK